MDDDAHGRYNTNSQIKLKLQYLKSGLWNYSDPYILSKGNIAVPNTAAVAASTNNTKTMCSIYRLDKLNK